MSDHNYYDLIVQFKAAIQSHQNWPKMLGIEAEAVITGMGGGESFTTYRGYVTYLPDRGVRVEYVQEDFLRGLAVLYEVFSKKTITAPPARVSNINEFTIEVRGSSRLECNFTLKEYYLGKKQ